MRGAAVAEEADWYAVGDGSGGAWVVALANWMGSVLLYCLWWVLVLARIEGRKGKRANAASGGRDLFEALLGR